MADPRIERYAALLVDRCVDVQPGWQVLVHSSPAARPLIEEVLRRIARRGAHALMRLSFGSGGPPET
ncbi:MAG TPA: aminopeptidase, partial [Gaiellaceae bacterium]